jgi:hypothetical protein
VSFLEEGKNESGFSINRGIFWGQWCPVHDGSPPAFDSTAYLCQICRRRVCAACIYHTNAGTLCFDCIKSKKGEITEIRPLYTKKISEKPTRISFARFIAVSYLFFIALIASALIGVGEPFFAAIGLLFSAVFFVALIVFLFKFEAIISRTRRLEDEIGRERAEELDRLVAKTRDSESENYFS